MKSGYCSGVPACCVDGNLFFVDVLIYTVQIFNIELVYKIGLVYSIELYITRYPRSKFPGNPSMAS